MPFFRSPALRGVFLSFCGFFIWSCTDALTKGAGVGGVSPFVIVALSSWSAVAVVFCAALFQRNIKILYPVRWKMQIARSPLFVIGSIINAIAFIELPLTTVYIAVFSVPFIITLIGAAFMGEKVNKLQVAAILLGFIGVLVALVPEMTASTGSLTSFLALFGFVALFVVDMLFLRVLGRTESAESMTFFSFAIRGIVFLPVFAFWPISALSLPMLAAILVMGVFAGAGFIFVSAAYKIAPVAFVAPVHYIQLVSGAVLGFLFFDTLPSASVVGGGALIIASGLILGRAAMQEKTASPMDKR